MLPTIDFKNIIPLTEARAKLSQLIQQTKSNTFFTLTKEGKPAAVLVSIELWQKVNEDLGKLYQPTFISEDTLPYIREFSIAEINRWLKEDQLTPKQKKLIKNRLNDQTLS